MNSNYYTEISNLEKNFIFNSYLDQQFFRRVYNTPLEIYQDKLSSIEFSNKHQILDAGCGFGQWTIPLSKLNQTVYAIDSDHNKITIAKKISNFYKLQNNQFQVSSVEDLPFKNNEFDAIFSYSVIYWTDVKKTIQEFFRILKHGGKIYFVGNGLGWSAYNLVTGHSTAQDFNARNHALKTIIETMKFSLTGKRKKGQAIFLSPSSLVKYMKNVGFNRIRYGPEGYLQLNKESTLHPFYPKKYLGLTNVFEILAEKK